MGPRSRANGSLEREIIVCLASADRPLTVAEVRAEVDARLAYSTVTTILTRLLNKGAVQRYAEGRGYAYQLSGGPTAAQASVTAHRMHRLLDGGVDRASVLSRFVTALDPEAERILRDLLEGSDER